MLALMAVIAVVSVSTPLGWRYVAERWFTLPNFFWLVPVLISGADSEPVDLARPERAPRQPCPPIYPGRWA
ncbi:hypothetical protein MJK72_11640 [Klebsiella pneumoniae]|nr:hypothetical protein MJK72_11640 [Klebsiella pneumoniae]